MKQGERRAAVAILAGLRKGGVVAHSGADLARFAGLKKTPYLMDIIAILIKKDLIRRAVHPVSPVKGWQYFATEKLMSFKDDSEHA